MCIMRAVLAAITTLVSLLCVAPVLVLVVPFWAIARLTRAIAPLFERPHVLWQHLIEYDPHIGWKPKANLDAYYLAHRDDMLTPYHIITDAQGWPGTRVLPPVRLWFLAIRSPLVMVSILKYRMQCFTRVYASKRLPPLATTWCRNYF